jgi:hypothetical protein
MKTPATTFESSGHGSCLTAVTLAFALLAPWQALTAQDADAEQEVPPMPAETDQGTPPGATDADPGTKVDAPPDEPASSAAFMSLAELDEGGPRGLRVNEPEAMAGYTLFGPLNSTSIYLVDMEGEVVHSWPTDSAPGAWCYLLDDGSLLRAGREDSEPRFSGGGIGGRIQRLAPDGTLLWQWLIADEQRQQHHDVEPLPGGNLLVISWERIGALDALKRGRDPRQVDREKGLWPDVILEVKPVLPEGVETVWEWHAWDHLMQDYDRSAPEYAQLEQRPGRLDINADHRDAPELTEEEEEQQAVVDAGMAALGYVGGAADDDVVVDQHAPPEKLPGDWLHTNAVAYNATHDLIALSSPHLSEIWVIDHGLTTEQAAGSTGGRWGQGGDVLWRWGNPRNYGHGTAADQRLFYQHDPTWVVGEDPDELRLLVFNNGRGREDGDYSSVDELVLPFDRQAGFRRGEAQAFGPTEPVWTYSDGDGFYSAFISGAQRLPNGNTLIASGAAGRIFEVTASGRLVWDYRNPFGGEVDPPEHAGRAPPRAIFRAKRLALDHPGVRALLE